MKATKKTNSTRTKKTNNTPSKKKSGYKYTIKTEGERKEVEWLISQGDFDSIEDYEDFWTKVETGKIKPAI